MQVIAVKSLHWTKQTWNFNNLPTQERETTLTPTVKLHNMVHNSLPEYKHTMLCHQTWKTESVTRQIWFELGKFPKSISGKPVMFSSGNDFNNNEILFTVVCHGFSGTIIIIVQSILMKPPLWLLSRLFPVNQICNLMPSIWCSVVK